MDKITARCQQLLQAYTQLAHIADAYKLFLDREARVIDSQTSSTLLKAEELRTMSRDSLIKRFEFCFDLTWKFLKLILKVEHDIDVASPRLAFQESLRFKLITEPEAQLLETLLDSRNHTAHIYGEELADRVATAIIKNFSVICCMIQNISKTRAP